MVNTPWPDVVPSKNDSSTRRGEFSFAGDAGGAAQPPSMADAVQRAKTVRAVDRELTVKIRFDELDRSLVDFRDQKKRYGA